MRFILIFIIISLGTFFSGQGQSLASNHCDSSILTPPEYEKCKIDSIYNTDIIARANYIIFLKTKLLPKFRIKRKALILSDDLKKDIKLLKAIYDSTLNYKLQRMTIDMDINQRYVQPKSYINSLLAFETLKIYPDIYAILLNEIHLSLNPKTDFDQLKQIQKIVDKIYSSLTNPMKDEVQQITLELTEERKSFTKDYWLDMFQGDINIDKRKQYNFINFLLWTE